MLSTISYDAFLISILYTGESPVCHKSVTNFCHTKITLHEIEPTSVVTCPYSIHMLNEQSTNPWHNLPYVYIVKLSYLKTQCKQRRLDILDKLINKLFSCQELSTKQSSFPGETVLCALLSLPKKLRQFPCLQLQCNNCRIAFMLSPIRIQSIMLLSI